MTIEKLQQHIPKSKVDGKMPNEEKTRWITLEELLPLQYYIVYGDPGGDGFLLTAKDETDFTTKLPGWITGDRNCDFPTTIYLIVKNGEEYTPTIT